MGVNKIDNQGENWYKMLQSRQMTDFDEQIISGTKCDRDIFTKQITIILFFYKKIFLVTLGGNIRYVYPLELKTHFLKELTIP